MLYPSDIPYLKMVNKSLALPKGEPIGRNCISFLMTNNRNESYDIMNETINMKAMNQYRYYYFNLRYIGKINGKTYRLIYQSDKKKIRKEVQDKTGVSMFPLDNPGMNTDNHNIYLDLSEYLKIFMSLTQRLTAPKKINLFWTYFKSIFNSEYLSKYPNRLVVININNFGKIRGSLKETLLNPVFILYYTLFRDYTLLSDLNLDFILYSGTFTLKINPSICDKDSYKAFMVELKKLYQKINVNIDNSLDEKEIMTQEREDVAIGEIVQTLNFVGSTEDGPITKLPEKESEDQIETIVAKKVKDASERANSIATPTTKSENQTVTKVVKTDAENMIETDPDVIKELYKINQKKAAPKSAASTARDKLLREKQEDIVVQNMTIRELKRLSAKHIEIPKTNVSNALHTTNENVKTVQFNNTNQTYIDKVMPKDITNAILSLNDKSLPIYIRNIKVEDTSNELNYIDTYTIELEDANRQRSTIKVDIPKFIDGKFMWLGGNKKIILNQNFLHPVVKTDKDTVQIVTNYNKMFITRDDIKSLGSIERLLKMLQTNDELQSHFTPGNVFESNQEYVSTIEYDEISKFYSEYKNGKTHLFFDQSVAQKYATDNKIKIPVNHMFVGLVGGKPEFINFDTQTTSYDQTIIDLIFDSESDDMNKKFRSIKTPKRLMYAKVKTMEKVVPVMILLSFWEGFTTVLKKMNATYRLSSEFPRDINPSESYLKFKDCYLIYQDNATTSILMNGMRQMKAEEYDLAEMDTKEPYLQVFKKIYGKISIANALDNSYEFSIDPITKEVLEDLNLPTGIVELMIYAVQLLADNQYTMEIDERVSRVRSIETIPAILYDTLAKNYITYKNSNGRKKLSIPRDSVIKKLLELKTVEDYSTLNPVLELERTRTVTSKGWRGVNLEDSYTVAKRTYDPTMTGIIGLSSSPDGSVGVAKTLTVEPKLNSVRGYTDISSKNEINKLKDVNLFSPGELTIPLGATRDDPTRLGHAIKQSKHVIPVKHSSPVLISNGMEEACRFNLSSDFVVNAKESGKVIEIDEKHKLMIVEYKSGKHHAVNLAPTLVKNGGGGFWESNNLVTNLKVGDKFKQNDPLAWHKEFFSNSSLNGCRMNIGTLTKVALISAYNTHQDATYITQKLSRDAASDMCFQRSVVVGKNANVSFMVNVGDEVEVGDSLIQFDTSFEDESLNELLATLSKDPRLEKEIMDSSRNNIKSKVAGKIEDIKIYATVDLDEMSPSLKRIVQSYYKFINEKKQILNKYDPEGSLVKCGMFFAESTSKVEPNKFGVIRGEKVEDSVLIEFYIKHEEMLEIGSKIANFTGVKNTISEIIPAGFEPYSEFREDEEISSIIAANSMLKRMTPSIILTVMGNKCIVELKRSLANIWYSNMQDNTKRSKMEKLIYDFFSAFDKSGTNTKKYKALFEPMSDNEFKRFFNSFTMDENAYLILDIVDYERTIVIDDIERAAKVLNVPLFETVCMPFVSMDKDNIVCTPQKVIVGYIHIKRTQQTVMKKNGISTSIDTRSAMTGQVTANDKNGRETDLENSMLISIGLDHTLRELNGPRADDMVMKNEMLHDIATKGYVRYDDLTNNLENKTTLNTVNAYIIGMSLSTDLVTTGLMLPKTLKEELR